MTIQILGIDIAKNVFQLHGVNRNGCVVLRRRVMRDQLLEVLAQIEPCTIVVEACTGAFCWARKFEGLGHQVKIISPQYVKPFVRRQKNDRNDRANGNFQNRTQQPMGQPASGAARLQPRHGCGRKLECTDHLGCNISLSRLRSATTLRNLAFSSSSCFSRRISVGSRPSYFFLQLK